MLTQFHLKNGKTIKNPFSLSQQKRINFQSSKKHSKIYKNFTQKVPTTIYQIKPQRKSLYNQLGSKQFLLKKKQKNERISLIRLTKTIQKSSFYYFIKNQGNNSKRVEQMLSLRGCWQKCLSKNNQNQINFYWNMSNNSNSKNQNLLFSRISGSYQLTDKARLYQNIVNYCSKNKISNQLFLPVTFCFTSKQTQSLLQQNINQFLEYFLYIQNHTNLTNSWIFKPTNLNRGRQIFLFNDLHKLFDLIFVGKPSYDQMKINSIKTTQLNKSKKYKSSHELEHNSQSKFIVKQQTIQAPSLQLLKQKLLFKKSNDLYQTKFNHSNQFQEKSKHDSNFRTTMNQFKLRKSVHKSINVNNGKTFQFGLKEKGYLTIVRQKQHKLRTQILQNLSQKNMQTKSIQYSRLKPKTKIQLNNHSSHKKHKKHQSTKIIENKHQKNQQFLRYKLSDALKCLVQGRNSLYGQKTNKKQIVIQKYIQNPYLINGNKFDIRIWVLVDQQFNVYVFKQGYLRFSSLKYKLDNKSIQNNFIHLTNHAVQKYSDKYQKQVNIVPMTLLKQHILKQKQKKHNTLKNRQNIIVQNQLNQNQTNQTKNCDNSVDKFKQIWNQIQRIILISLEATIGQFYKQEHNQRKYHTKSQFQIFGYDFLLDRQLNVRLIQANCNPSITEDNQYLQQAVPRMLNDAFKLTIDRDFIPTKSSKSYFYMKGFSTQNMWKKIGKIGQTNLNDIKHSFQ